LIAVTVGLLGGSAWASSPKRQDRSSTVSTATATLKTRELSIGTAVNPRLVLSIAMTNLNDGFGLASQDIDAKAPLTGINLVRTSDGGASWRVLARLPWLKQRTFIPFYYSDSYVNEQVANQLMIIDGDLYVASPTGTRIYLSRNEGESWHRVQLVGQLRGADVDGQELWITTSRCAKLTATSDRCNSYLFTYRQGSLHPSSQARIPGSAETALVQPDVSPGPRYYRQALFMGGVGKAGGVFVDADTVGDIRATLWLTTDAGATWHNLEDPCRSLLETALVTTPATRWVLYCSLDGGMNQGTNELFSSGDDGTTWHLFAAANEGRTLHVGHFDDAMSAEFQASGDGVDFWQEPSVGPFVESGDRGLTWHRLSGGFQSQAPIDALGPSDAWVVQPGTGIWRTINGTSWSLLR
jgi:hypothetical protein